jgi:hypothetical protein
LLEAGGASFASIAEAQSFAISYKEEISEPPQLIESTGNWNIVWFRDAAYAVPHSAGQIDLTDENDRARMLEAGGASFASIAEAQSFAIPSGAGADHTT